MTKTPKFRCLLCNARASQRFDQCRACDEWETCVTLTITAGPGEDGGGFVRLGDVAACDPERISIDREWDKALGGGLAVGSEVILWGRPGANKTTEMLRACAQLGDDALYLNSEMRDATQGAGMLRMLADRAGIDSSRVISKFVDTPRDAAHAIVSKRWKLVVADSVTAMISSTHVTANGVRAASADLRAASKAVGSALVMILHSRRDGEVSAPQWVLHMCDTTVCLSPSTIIVPKNRFGPSPMRIKRKRAPLRLVG